MRTGVPRRLIVATVKARLDEIANLTVYLRRVPSTPPTISPTDPRVRPYVVMHPSPGRSDDERLGGDTGLTIWSTQVTCVTGTEEALEPLVDLVLGRLVGWRPAFEDYPTVGVGRLRPPLGYEPGASRRDDGESPSRFWTPLQFQLAVN